MTSFRLKIMLIFNNIFLLIVVCFFLASCQINTTSKRALSVKEKAVKLAKGDQETSLKLYNNCRENGKVETFYHIDNARIRAVEKGTNTVQVIYATNYNGSTAYDVKFWRCK